MAPRDGGGRTGAEAARSGAGTSGAMSAAGGPGAARGTEGRSHGRERAVFVISVAAELAGVHPQTLRIYERKGLVDPGRTIGGSRRYSEVDIERIQRIQDLTAAGLNLEGVRRVIELEEEVRRLHSELARAGAEIRQAIEDTHRQYRRDLVPVSFAPVVWTGERQRQR